MGCYFFPFLSVNEMEVTKDVLLKDYSLSHARHRIPISSDSITISCLTIFLCINQCGE